MRWARQSGHPVRFATSLSIRKVRVVQLENLFFLLTQRPLPENLLQRPPLRLREIKTIQLDSRILASVKKKPTIDTLRLQRLMQTLRSGGGSAM